MIEKIYLIEINTVFRSGKAVKGASLFIDSLVHNGLPFLILTEQSGKTRTEMVTAMKESGIAMIAEADIYTSAMAAVDWIVRFHPEYIKVVGFGGRGIKEAIAKGGFIADRDNPHLVFAGLNRSLNYYDYSSALRYLLQGAKLVCTDGRKIMTYDGAAHLGNAAIVRMLEYAADTQAVDFSRGSRHYLDEALRFLKVQPDQVVFVGRDFQKDILPARAMGMETVLITDGEGIMEMGITDECYPTYIVEDLYGLAK